MRPETYQAHHVPQHLQQGVQVKLLGAADGDAVALSRYRLHLLQAAHCIQENYPLIDPLIISTWTWLIHLFPMLIRWTQLSYMHTST